MGIPAADRFAICESVSYPGGELQNHPFTAIQAGDSKQGVSTSLRRDLTEVNSALLLTC